MAHPGISRSNAGNRSSYNLLAHDTPVSSRLNSRQPSEIPAAGSCSTKIASQFCPENATVAVGTQRFAWSDRGMESSQKEFRPATRIIDRKHLDSKNLLLQDHKVSAPLPEERRGVKATPAPELKETPAQGVKIFSNHDNTFLTSRVFAPVPANYCYRRMKGSGDSAQSNTSQSDIFNLNPALERETVQVQRKGVGYVADDCAGLSSGSSAPRLHRQLPSRAQMSSISLEFNPSACSPDDDDPNGKLNLGSGKKRVRSYVCF